MKIVIAGAGSIGTVLAHNLGIGGFYPLLLRRRGLFGKILSKMIGAIEDQRALDIHDILIPLNNKKVDVLFITTQKQQTSTILEYLNKNLDINKNTIIVPLQNGLNVIGAIINKFPDSPIIQGIVWWSATLIDYNLIYYHRKAATYLGNINGTQENLDLIAKLMAEFELIISDNIEKEVHKKLILNLVSPVLALTKTPYPEGINDLKVRSIIHILFDEVLSIVDWEVDHELSNFHRILASNELIAVESSNYPPHKVSTQISAEKHGGKGSNARELLQYFIDQGAPACEKIIIEIEKLPQNYLALDQEAIQKILVNIENLKYQCNL